MDWVEYLQGYARLLTAIPFGLAGWWAGRKLVEWIISEKDQ